MARGAITVKIDGKYDDKDINRAIKDLNALKVQSGAAAGPMAGLGKAALGMGAAFAGAASIGAVVDFMKDAAAAAAADEKSVVALATAMDNLGLAHSNAGVEKFIKDMMLATGVADDQLRPAYQKLVTATGDVTKAQDLLGLAMDIAAGTGKDLSSVSQALAKASMGQVSALTRLGVPLDANIVKTKDFAAAQAVLTDKFGGQAAAAAETYAGKMARVTVAVDEAKETIGYALLNAIDDATAALGGVGEFQAGIASIGDSIANAVTGFGVLLVKAAELKAMLDADGESGNAFLDSLKNVGAAALQVATGPTMFLFNALGILGEETNKTRDQMDALRESAAANDVVLPNLSRNMVVNANAAADAADEVERLKDAYKAFDQALSASKNRDDFRFYLRGLDEALKGNEDSFRRNAKGAEENRDAIRTALGQAATIAKDWGEQTGASAEEINTKFKSLRKDIIKEFVDQGFTRKEIKKFLGDEGIWAGPAKDAVDSAKSAGVAAAPQAGKAVGSTFSSGLAAGIGAGEWAVIREAVAVVRAAEAAARKEADSHSPSRVWAAIGSDLVEGLIQGLDSKKEKAKQAAEEMLSAIADKASGIVDKWDAKLVSLADVLEKAQADVDSWASNMQQSLLSGFDIGAAYEAAIGKDGKLSAANWIAGVDAQIAEMEWFANVLNAVRADGGVNGQALMDYLASKGAAAGGAMGQALIDAGLVQTMADKLATVTTQADTMAQAMVPPYLTAGVAAAQAHYDGFAANYGKGGPARVALENLMDRIAASLGREVTVSIKTVYAAAGIDGARASGGPVRSGGTYLVGERGPELVTMGSSGFVTPNDSLRSGSSKGGNTYNVNVSTGVGDPRKIGQEVIEVIKRFEASNGKVFAAA